MQLLLFSKGIQQQKLSLCLRQSAAQPLVKSLITQLAPVQHSCNGLEDGVFIGCAEGQSQSLGLPALTSSHETPNLLLQTDTPISSSSCCLASHRGKSQ